MSYIKQTSTQTPIYGEPTSTKKEKDIVFVSDSTDKVKNVDDEKCGEPVQEQVNDKMVKRVVKTPLSCDMKHLHKTKLNSIFNTQNLDIVEHPNHYGAGSDGLQCIEAMLQTFGKQATMDFCKLNSFKYIWRSDHKDKETQDMEKAKRYLEYWHVLNNLPGDSDDGTFHDYLNS